MALVGIPLKLVYEGLGHTVTIELRSGDMYRGVLENAEDNMNCLISNCTLTKKDGSLHSLDQVYIRGSAVVCFIFPDMLKHAPMFKFQNAKNRSVGLVGMRRAMTLRARSVRGRGTRGATSSRGRGTGANAEPR